MVKATLPTPNVDNAAASAAKILLDFLPRVPGDRDASAKTLDGSALLIFGIRWDIQAVSFVTSNRLNSLLARLGNTTLQRVAYDRATNLRNEAIRTDRIFSPNGENGGCRLNASDWEDVTRG